MMSIYNEEERSRVDEAFEVCKSKYQNAVIYNLCDILYGDARDDADDEESYEALIKAITNEESQEVMLKKWDTIGEIGRTVLAKSEWPELLEFIFENFDSSTYKPRIRALLITGQLTRDPAIIEKLIPRMDTLC
ncbi:hypothetical protein L2E82_34770 [Cichorium intybus]|uniref:Uncharacterized protein n=1 Tax=Cichorium intybus TaxID=13427 RepID=A0ACB9BMY4_CICIN|nr:hypothetical protein L2E82_34770 [Cichorium intybus]